MILFLCRFPLVLCFVIVIQTFVYLAHKVISLYKNLKSTLKVNVVEIPMKIQPKCPVIDPAVNPTASGPEVIVNVPTLPKNQAQPSFINLNTMAFNPDLLNTSIITLSIIVPPFLAFIFLLDELHYATFQIISHSLFCFYIPFLVCICNKKLRCFITSRFF